MSLTKGTLYYEEEEIKYGVLGIKIELVDLDEVLMKREKSYQNMMDHLFPDGMK